MTGTSNTDATRVSYKDITISPHISGRVYLPKRATTTEILPILVYYHCVESAFSTLYHPNLHAPVSQANIIAVSFEYRLTPTVYEDCWEVLQWVASHASNNGQHASIKEPWLVNHGNFEKMFVGGDSDGENIVHNVAIRAGKEPINQKAKLLGEIILSFPNEYRGDQSIAGVQCSKLHDEAVDVEEEDHYFPIVNSGIEIAKDIINRIASFIHH